MFRRSSNRRKRFFAESLRLKGFLLKVDAFTDGSARGNPGRAGYGAVLRFVDRNGRTHEKELSQGYERTTNNAWSFWALSWRSETLKSPCEVTLYTDSQYVANAFNQHWVDGWLKRGWKNAKKEPVKNVDLAALAEGEARIAWSSCGSRGMRARGKRAVRPACHGGRRRGGAHRRHGLYGIGQD